MRLALRLDIQLVGGGGGGGGGCQWRRVLVVVVSGQVVHLQGPQHMKVTRISSLVLVKFSIDFVLCLMKKGYVNNASPERAPHFRSCFCPQSAVTTQIVLVTLGGFLWLRKLVIVIRPFETDHSFLQNLPYLTSRVK